MRWALRFLLWAIPLTWLATSYYPQYLAFLCEVATRLFATMGIEVRLVAVDVLAPIDLALFAALALSTFAVRWPSRLARLAVGLAMLFVLEVVVVVIGVLVVLILGFPPESPVRLLFQNAETVIGWAGAPLVWILLFRPREILRIASRPAPDAPGHRGAAPGLPRGGEAEA